MGRPSVCIAALVHQPALGSQPGTRNPAQGLVVKRNDAFWEYEMGKGILLWLLGIPIPIIILLLLFWH
jgi:hypothetical protein